DLPSCDFTLSGLAEHSLIKVKYVIFRNLLDHSEKKHCGI
ncbi:hypothetical protein CEXT_57051, partial [Caerostris extrusa]